MAYQVLWGYANKKPLFLGEKRLFHIQDNALKLGALHCQKVLLSCIDLIGGGGFCIGRFCCTGTSRSARCVIGRAGKGDAGTEKNKKSRQGKCFFHFFLHLGKGG